MTEKSEAAKFHYCSEKHHMVIQRIKQKEAGQAHSFFRVCKFCGALEIRRVEFAKDALGNIFPKVTLFIVVGGKNIRLPVRSYKLVYEDKGEQNAT